MESITLTLFIALSVPLLLMLGLVEKKSRLCILYLFIGMFLCLFVTEINGLLLNFYTTDYFLYFTTNITPVTEELLKAAGVIYFAFVISDDREQLVTAGMAEGIGFALLENAVYYYSADSVSLHYVLLRVFGSGLMHGLCTAAVGYGASWVKSRKKLFYSGSLSLFILASVCHAIYNSLVQSEFDVIGYLLPIVTYIPVFILIQKGRRHKEGN